MSIIGECMPLLPCSANEVQQCTELRSSLPSFKRIEAHQPPACSGVSLNAMKTQHAVRTRCNSSRKLVQQTNEGRVQICEKHGLARKILKAIDTRLSAQENTSEGDVQLTKSNVENFCQSTSHRHNSSSWRRCDEEKDFNCEVAAGVSVTVGSSSPSDLLQGRGYHCTSLSVLQQQGAIKVHCDSVWEAARDCSSFLNLKHLQDNSVKLKSLRGQYSILQQSLPSGTRSDVKMVEDDSKSTRTSFGTMLAELDTTFKSTCSPYLVLGPTEREALFLNLLRARIEVRNPYLTSVALGALDSSTATPSKDSHQNKLQHGWAPSSVSGSSFLRGMLHTCEQRCLPEEICVSASSVAASMMKGRRQLLEGNQSKEMLVAKRRSGEDENHISLNSTDRSVISGNGCAGALWGAGIISPWLYFMSIGSMFCCHIEDYAFGSANVILAPPESQAWVIWYSIPQSDMNYLHEYLRNLLGLEYSIDCLEQRKLWLDPTDVIAWRGSCGEKISVFRHLQGPSEYIATDYGSVHWGVNIGVGWKAAVNFAYPSWRKAAESVHLIYKKLETTTGQVRNYRSVPNFENPVWQG
ncbi:uncharacterized protein MICPUCDRAFT_55793 [Micromonas pusilla CCMP1545]|uniref:JmjC domain-containing protein n=1 Tax=Micromonas pusilla (strain CCMP1545) TaxID=564608 RepID=C1MLP7_MICPC|nr:uncharacterized protein MICPUCDRAFT_55793 [Micromonas pusilla CCMP1545]EEH59981.1 hypothetical protein MICPUCDRAFT_55793 [Micromonas pusilla CCMP1545]|eukprot:XP_003056605.1 hypothetical protein MICPUCDRAFT_55793 [Micromonas pusilla CCMP1545]